MYASPLRPAWRVRVPPLGMAWAAFMARAITTCFSDSASIRAAGRPPGTRKRTRMRLKAGWRSRSLRAVCTVTGSSAVSPGEGRAESSRKRTICSERATSSRIRSRNFRASRAVPGALAASELRASAQPAMPDRGFEISWATPATSWPRKASRSEAISLISRARRSVRSSNQESTCVTSPPRRTGRRRMWKRRPWASVNSSWGSPLRNTSCRTAAVLLKAEAGISRWSGRPRAFWRGFPIGPCSRSRFQAATRSSRLTR